MKVILVPVADRPECARALRVAFDLGKRVEASVSGVHMRPHRHSNVSLSTAFADADWRKKDSKTANAAAKALYEKAAQNNGYEMIRRGRMEPGALYSEKVGSPDVLMGIVGPASDMVVVSRPARKGGVAEMFMNAALMESTCPTLILPQRSKVRIGHRVMIGWNQSPEVARAVRAAVPILRAAEEVTLVNCGPEDRPGPKASQMANYLKHWGVSVRRHTTKGNKVEDELTKTYKELKADLLIMGSYSRSRWREKVFGGTSEYLLHKADIPLLMVHR